MSASITSPGYWLVASPSGSGIVRYTSTGQISSATGAVYLGGQSINPNNLQNAIGQLGTVGLDEVPGGLTTLIGQAESKGSALLKQTPSGATWDPSFTVLAAGLGLTAGGALAAAAGDAALGAGEAAAGAGADAAETATGGGLAGGAASYALKGLSSLSSLAKAGGIAALLVDPSFLWRMVKIVGGLGLVYLGVKQLATVGSH